MRGACDTLAIHHLGATVAAASPIAAAVAGKVGSKILLAAVVVAMFDTGLSANLGYARIYFASGRDRMWPAPVSGALASTNRNQVPKWAFAFLGIACAVFCYLTGLTSLITFTSVMIVTIYLLIATAAIISRLRERDANAPSGCRSGPCHQYWRSSASDSRSATRSSAHHHHPDHDRDRRDPLARLPQPPHQARAEPGVKPSMIAAERMRHPNNAHRQSHVTSASTNRQNPHLPRLGRVLFCLNRMGLARPAFFVRR
jgi:hypothetical protein